MVIPKQTQQGIISTARVELLPHKAAMTRNHRVTLTQSVLIPLVSTGQYGDCHFPASTNGLGDESLLCRIH